MFARADLGSVIKMRRPKISEKRTLWGSLAMTIFQQSPIALSIELGPGARADVQTDAKSAYLSR